MSPLSELSSRAESLHPIVLQKLQSAADLQSRIDAIAALSEMLCPGAGPWTAALAIESALEHFRPAYARIKKGGREPRDRYEILLTVLSKNPLRARQIFNLRSKNCGF